MNITLKIKMIALATLVSFAGTAFADVNVKWRGVGGITDWNDANGWQNMDGDNAGAFEKPDATSWVRIGDYHEPASMPVMDSGTNAVKSLFIGYGSNGVGTFTINGGTLTIGDAANINSTGISLGNFNDAVGTYTQTGGDVILVSRTQNIGSGTTADGQTFNMSGGTLTDADLASPGNWNISTVGYINFSGTASFDAFANINTSAFGTGNLSMTGSGTSLTFNRWNSYQDSELNIIYTADATGISVTNVTQLRKLNFGGDDAVWNLSIDLTNYSTSNGNSFDLLTVDNVAGTITGFDSSIWDSVTITGGTADLVYTGNGGTGGTLSVTNIAGTSGDVDTDGDGLPDFAETNTGTYVSASDTGTDPNVADSDGDGLSDSVEVQLMAGFNPNEDNTTLINLLPSGLTEQDIIDLRVGSRLASIADNQATLQIVIEESTDLSTWSENQTTDVQVTVPEGTTKQFFRYSMGD